QDRAAPAPPRIALPESRVENRSAPAGAARGIRPAIRSRGPEGARHRRGRQGSRRTQARESLPGLRERHAPYAVAGRDAADTDGFRSAPPRAPALPPQLHREKDRVDELRARRLAEPKVQRRAVLGKNGAQGGDDGRKRKERPR